MSIPTIAGGFLIAIVLGTAAAHAEYFDKPLHKQVLNLGDSPELMRTDHRPVTVTCWYYAHLMVKEQKDPGLKGAELIALALVQPGHLPKCSLAMQPGEREFKEWNEESKAFVGWNGYFTGVKHNLVFLERPDGDENSGIPFAVFESDAQTKYFSDSVMLRARGERPLNFRPTSGNQITLRYLRVASASCSIPKSGESCWGKLKQQTGLTHSHMPNCSDYEGKEAGTAASVVAYPVEVSLFPKPTTRPLGSPVMCYPAQ